MGKSKILGMTPSLAAVMQKSGKRKGKRGRKCRPDRRHKMYTLKLPRRQRAQEERRMTRMLYSNSLTEFRNKTCLYSTPLGYLQKWASQKDRAPRKAARAALYIRLIEAANKTKA